jgi:hypothetical protein
MSSLNIATHDFWGNIYMEKHSQCGQCLSQAKTYFMRKEKGT